MYGWVEDRLSKSLRKARMEHDADFLKEGVRVPRSRTSPVSDGRSRAGLTLSYATFPAEHWQKIWSNDPLERLNKDIKRRKWWRCFPNEEAVIRLQRTAMMLNQIAC